MKIHFCTKGYFIRLSSALDAFSLGCIGNSVLLPEDTLHTTPPALDKKNLYMVASFALCAELGRPALASHLQKRVQP